MMKRQGRILSLFGLQMKKKEKRLLLRFLYYAAHIQRARDKHNDYSSSRERKNVHPILLTGDNVPRFSNEALIQPVQKVVLGQSVDDDFFFNRQEHVRVAREIGAKMYAHRETRE